MNKGNVQIKKEIIMSELKDLVEDTGYILCLTDEARNESHSLKWEDEKYSIKGHVEVECNFPADYYIIANDESKSDYYSVLYSDRLSAEQKRKIDHLPKGFDYEKITQDQLYELGTLLSGRDDITGVRIVRDTTVITGHPVWHIDMFAKNKNTPRSKITWDNIHKILEVKNVEIPNELKIRKII